MFIKHQGTTFGSRTTLTVSAWKWEECTEWSAAEALPCS